MPRERDQLTEPAGIAPLGSEMPSTNAVRCERCSAFLTLGFYCDRQKGHDGSHSVGIVDSDRVYVWPRSTIPTMTAPGDARECPQCGERLIRETIETDDHGVIHRIGECYNDHVWEFVERSLPDDSPHKITRADVDMLLSSAKNDHDAYVNRDAMNQLAAKLAALLPPETPDAA